MGILYVVATPVGNLEDTTIRAVRILLSVPVIACEDTRRTGQLISILRERFMIYDLGTKPKYVSVRDWNEAEVGPRILEELARGDVALVSDAGTPLISDPGFKVVRAVREAGYQVSPIPGPSAGIAALSASGLPTNKFIFWGFLPKKWAFEPGVTNIVYESPVRINKTLKLIRERYPEAQIVVANELTKLHEAIFLYAGGELNLKGEVTLLIFTNLSSERG